MAGRDRPQGTGLNPGTGLMSGARPVFRRSAGKSPERGTDAAPGKLRPFKTFGDPGAGVVSSGCPAEKGSTFPQQAAKGSFFARPPLE